MAFLCGSWVLLASPPFGDGTRQSPPLKLSLRPARGCTIRQAIGGPRAGKGRLARGRGRMLAARRALWPGWRGWSCERKKMKLLTAAALLGLGGGLLMLLFPGTHAEERKKGPKVTVKVSKRGGGGEAPRLNIPRASLPPPRPTCFATGFGARAAPVPIATPLHPPGSRPVPGGVSPLPLLASFWFIHVHSHTRTCGCARTRVSRPVGVVGNGNLNPGNRPRPIR